MIFNFGSMRDMRVFEVVLGRRVDPRLVIPGVLHGWEAHAVESEVYPVLLPVPPSIVHGNLVVGLGAGDWRRIEHYEAGEYSRTLEPVYERKSGGKTVAWVYTRHDPVKIRPRPELWNYERYQQMVPAYLPGVAEWMDQL